MATCTNLEAASRTPRRHGAHGDDRPVVARGRPAREVASLDDLVGPSPGVANRVAERPYDRVVACHDKAALARLARRRPREQCGLARLGTVTDDEHFPAGEQMALPPVRPRLERGRAPVESRRDEGAEMGRQDRGRPEAGLE